MFKLYKANRDAQIQWMLENKGKTVAINVIGIALALAYIAYQDRKMQKKWDEEDSQMQV